MLGQGARQEEGLKMPAAAALAAGRRQGKQQTKEAT